MSQFSLFSRFRSSSCFVFSSAVVVSLTAFVPTQAQTPTFNVAEYAEYNGKTDDEAASFAADVARRAAVAPVRNVKRPTPTPQSVQNRPTRQNTSNIPTTRRDVSPSSSSSVRPTGAPKSQAARTWEAFLFGTPNRPVSTPKFAFAQRGAASPVRVSRSQPAQIPQTTQSPQTARPLPSAPTAQTDVPPSDAEIAAARRRRLQELNALLATRRPEEFSRRLALNAAEPAFPAQPFALVDAENNDYAEYDDSFAADAPALPILVAEPNAEQADVAFRDRAELARESVDAPFDAARANRSKIRQASNFEPADPAPLELADDGFAAFLLPTRPNALRLSPNVFLSTDLVRLPSAAPLREIAENAQTAPTTQAPSTTQTVPTTQTASTTQTPSTTQTASTAQTAPRVEPLQSESNVQPTRPLQDAQTPATVATPLPAAPSTDVPTLRPTAQFVEPRFLPTRR